MLIYSHLHKDHIGGSIAFKSIPGLQIIALDTVSDFLKEMKDPNRLIQRSTKTSSRSMKRRRAIENASSGSARRTGHRPIESRTVQTPSKIARLCYLTK